MKRSFALVIAALAILALPATASAVDTRIDKMNEHAGLLVPTGPTTWTVQDLDYNRIATVQRTSSKRFDFLRDGKAMGSARKIDTRVWRVFKGDKAIGTVRVLSRRHAKAYIPGTDDAIGLGDGVDAIPAAASVVFGFKGRTGVAKHDHGSHRH